MKTHYNLSITKHFFTLGWSSQRVFKLSFLGILLSACTFLHGQQVYKFTNCGAVGSKGPTQAQINTAYASTNLSGLVTSSNGIQLFTVPASGTYKIEAYGGQGFNAQSGYTGGKGAKMSGEFYLIGGQTLKIVVGQAGLGSYGSNGGGGGGSFVTLTDNTPLIIAGGGAGSRAAVSQNSCDGRITKAGGELMISSTSPCNAKPSGIGYGGAISSSWGSAGGGLLGDGANDGTWGNGGKAFINGAEGGTGGSCGSADGGFGCGGSGGGCNGGGGGGGYSGGDGGYMAGGGGSYNVGDNQSNTPGVNTGHGKVDITVISVGAADIEAVSVKPVTPNPGVMCVKTPYEFDITLKNNGPDDATFLNFEVTVPGMPVLKFDFFDVRDLANGTSKVYRISSQKVTMPTTGTGGITLNLTKVLSDSDDTTNNRVTNYYPVTSLPYGSSFLPDNNFNNFPGYPGTDKPDLITHDKTYRYNFKPPTGYANIAYGSTWACNFYAVMDDEALPSDRYNVVFPSGSNDGYVTMKFKKEDIDKDVFIYFTLKDKSYGMCDSVISRQLHIAPMPDVTYEDVGGCLGSVLQFVNNSSIASGTIPKVFWDFGDGSTSTLFSPQKVFNTKGIYNVKLVVTSDLGFADSMIKTINVIETPVADFAFDNQCGLNPFQFTNNSTLAAGTMTYVWNFGDENESTLKDPTHVYTQPGPYQVTLTATSDNGCHSEITKSVYNYPNPVANFTSPANICQNSNVTLSNLTTIPFSSWGSEWTIGSNNVRSFDKNPLVTFTAYGEQLITLKTTSQFGCVDSMTKSIVVMEAPIINFSTSDVCNNSPIIFNSGITNIDSTIDFIWNIDGILYADREPSVKFDSAGEYNMSLTVNYDNGCSAFKASSVRTGYRPNADFDIAQTTCAGNTLQLANNTTVEFGNFHSFWDMGDGMTYGDMTTPLHTYSNTSPESYVITLIASSKFGICPDTISKTVNVGIIPSCDFTINHDWTFGQRGYTFDVPVVGADYKWYFGDGVVSTAPNPNHQYSNDGKFKVKLIVTSPEGCQCEKTLEHVVQNLDVNSTFAQLGFELFPNPSNGIVTIANNNNVTVSNIAVSNMVGETVLLSTQNNTNAQYIIDLSNMANGVYLIRVTTHDNQVLTHKVIIAK